ncbi:MAG: RNA polymerase sigma factor, partial [Blastocatellia bacterium]
MQAVVKNKKHLVVKESNLVNQPKQNKKYTYGQPIEELTNSELIRLCYEKKTEDVWQEFYSRFNRYIKLYIRKALEGYKTTSILKEIDFLALKEDLEQEVYLRLVKNDYQALKSYDGSNNCFHSYLHKIATNVVLEYLRQHYAKKRQAKLISLTTLLEENSKKQSNVYLIVNNGFSELAYQITQLINKASGNNNSKRDKEIFFLHLFYGMASSEIAQSLNTNLSSSGVDSI